MLLFGMLMDKQKQALNGSKMFWFKWFIRHVRRFMYKGYGISNRLLRQQYVLVIPKIHITQNFKKCNIKRIICINLI